MFLGQGWDKELTEITERVRAESAAKDAAAGMAAAVAGGGQAALAAGGAEEGEVEPWRDEVRRGSWHACCCSPQRPG
jgi:hypothetical protein